MSTTRHLAAYIAPPPPVVPVPVSLVGNAAATSGDTSVLRFVVDLRSLVYVRSSVPLASLRKVMLIRPGTTRVQSQGMGVLQVPRGAPQLSQDCAIFFPYNRWSDPALGSISASTAVSAFPASNTQKQQRSKVWRSTSTTSWILRDLGNSYRMNGVAIVSHNATPDGTFRVRCSNVSDFSTTLFDSGTIRTWEPAFATSGVLSELADASGYPTASTIALLRYCGEAARTVRWLVFNEVVARYVRIDFTDTGNSDGYNELAWAYCGMVVRVTPAQVYGWQLWPESVTRTHRSANGTLWIDQLYRQLRATANFDSQGEETSMAFWEFLTSYVGTTREMVVAFQPDTLPKKFWFSLYCHFSQIPQVENKGFRTYTVPVELAELV